MGQETLSTGPYRYPKPLAKYVADMMTSLNSMLTELFTDTVFAFPIMPHASKTVYNLLVARRSYTVTAIDFVPDVVQGAGLTGTVVKATGTAAPASGTTPMHTANAINMNTTVNTVQSITLTSTVANLSLVAGERIGLVLSGALSTGSGCLTIRATKS